MGCYMIKEGVCPCTYIEKDNVSNNVNCIKSSDRSNNSSEHNIWRDNPTLQREFEHSISKAVYSVADSEESSSFGKSSRSKLESIKSTKTVQKKQPSAETTKKTNAYLKSKTVDN